MLSANDFTGLKLIIFGSTSRCSLQASGLIFSDFDFQGRQLQDLGPETRDLDLLSLHSPSEYGWAFVLAWHESSDLSYQRFIYSLAESGRGGAKIEDMLLRFSLACCENHAIRISWWDSLPTVAKNHALNFMADPTLGIRADYLGGYPGYSLVAADRLSELTNISLLVSGAQYMAMKVIRLSVGIM
ncbi:hypothetical protein BLL42_26820 [Pseudomonas frederiksbergensis]|uniref:Uncharacterized protein n=1 Tax=Pseudomonas frederiksbergensis TaxID=104087 RepID=A0A1J0ESI6_9PSED|nr:hypothetical protein [Pseudomonas frederiksbergensis]APC19133.1 hypothetical protein BLL42_26820 [Pseudomonas frederiksbergensis]